MICAHEQIIQESPVTAHLYSHFLCFSSCVPAATSLYCSHALTAVSVPCSHNTKTTTWLDPRLAKKAKPPEKCEDGGMYCKLLLLFMHSHKTMFDSVCHIYSHINEIV